MNNSSRGSDATKIMLAPARIVANNRVHSRESDNTSLNMTKRRNTTIDNNKMKDEKENEKFEQPDQTYATIQTKAYFDGYINQED